MVPRLIARLALIVPFATLLSLACDDGGPTDPVAGAPGVVAVITLTANPATVAGEGTRQFSAAGQDGTGASVTIPGSPGRS